MPRREIQDFAAEACLRTFAALVDALQKALGRLRGVWGDYNIKTMLDLLVLLGCVPPGAISRWPVACPGYQESFAVLFPGLKEEHHLKALYWVHRRLTRGVWRFQFPESAAQLCWDHRRLNGTLVDRMDHADEDDA